ncbi:helix-turn-helix transcriptional regulator [Heyndrickxia oleronia]|uniref:helix-turn-helix transcriptional regulator n=1 Tax=Heyndrickxia oleronia TaxID=38875 RepID=UPI0020420772|nr:helix-turn-helix transcriptional regulator [Heyndrickxia oleronia]MCM3452783.1 helix-turn-helix transcriptional regulator [Heyndrickxia oleronia]
MDKKLIGQKLMDLRGDKSRDEVATAINISISALQMYENGQRIPRDEIKVKLAEYYKSTVQDIFFNNKQHELCNFRKQKEVC